VIEFHAPKRIIPWEYNSSNVVGHMVGTLVLFVGTITPLGLDWGLFSGTSISLISIRNQGQAQIKYSFHLLRCLLRTKL